MSQSPDGRRFVFSQISNLASWPTDANITGEQFCLLLLCGDARPGVDDIENFTSRAVRQGMVYLSICGTASDWIEEVVDDAHVGTGARSSPTLMTTAHKDLDEAIAYFEADVRPPSAHCDLWWVVAVDGSGMADRALEKLESRRAVGRLAW